MPPPKKIKLLVKKSKINKKPKKLLTEPDPVPLPPSPSDLEQDITYIRRTHTNSKTETTTDTDTTNISDSIELKTDLDDTDDYMTLSSEQKEYLIDQLESKKFKIKKQYHEASDSNIKQKLKGEYEEIRRLLANVKECDAWDKINKNKTDSKQLRDEFKKRYKRLAINDFNKIIDLTAPKEDRKPDISTEQIWHRSKNVVFKGKTYRQASDDKIKKFNNKMKLKSMPSGLKKDINKRLDGNLNAYHLHNTNNAAVTQYHRYDPFNYQGTYIY